MPKLTNRLLLLCLLLALFGPAPARERKSELKELLNQGAVVYYGAEPRDKSRFTKAKVVILEPSHWTTRSIRNLQDQGKVVLGYLSVGELISTTRTRKNYRALSFNNDWNSMRVDPADLGWRKTMLRRTMLVKERLLDGMMLDTVDTVVHHPEATDSMVELIKVLHREMPDRFLMTNRGFSILPEVSLLIDGVVFENANNRAFTSADQEWVEAQCQMLVELDIPVLILDYAEHTTAETSEAMAERFDWNYYLAPSAALSKPLTDFRE